MAAVIRYIDINSTPGGDGTTDATTGVNRAYASFAEWLTAESADLVTAGDTHTVYVAAGLYAEELATDSQGFITNATNNLKIFAKPGDECTTLDFSNGARIVDSTSGTSAVVSLNNTGTVMYGIGVHNTSSLSSARGVTITNPSTLIGVIARGGANSTGNGFYQAEDNTVHYIYCISAYSGGNGFFTGNFDDAKYYNCLAWKNGDNGFNRSGTGGTIPTLINCAAIGNATTGFADAFNPGSSNNASDDGTAPGSAIVTNALLASDFVDYVNDNYLIAPGGALDSTGADLTTELTALDALVDINGDSLATPFNVGPDAYSASGPVAVNLASSVPNQTQAASSAYTLDLNQFFNGTETPFTYTVQAGTLPSNISIVGTDLTGTPNTVETQVGIVIRATDQNANVADTNTFQFEVTAAAAPPVGVPAITSVAATTTSLDITYSYTDGDETSIEYRLDGGVWIDVGLTNPFLISSLTPNTSYDIELRAVNADGAGTASAPAAYVTDQVTVTLTSDVLVTNTVVEGAPVILSNTNLDYIALYDLVTGELIYRETGVTTDVNGQFSITTTIPADSYRVDWKVTGGSARMPTGTAA